MRSVRKSLVMSWTTLSVFLLLLFSNSPVMAAQDAVVCPADRLNSNGNICTASDVQLAAAAVGNVDEGLTCMPGDLVEVAIGGTVNLRKGDRYDIGIWISSDGLPMDLRGGNDLFDPGNVPDEGGAKVCEVLPLPFLGVAADNTVSPNIIDSLDDAATPQDCYDTNAANNGDQASGILLTSDRDSIINGMVDVNADNIIDGTDNSGLLVIVGYHVFAGLLDMDDDGIGGGVGDDGVWNGYAVEDGIIDVDGDGVFGAVDGTDDSAQAFNDSVTMKCIAGRTGKLALESLVSWHVPSDKDDICAPINPDSYGPFGSSKCSVNSSEIDVEIVGKLTIVKSAPAALAAESFQFSYTNSSPTFADTSDLIDDISETSPFNLMDGESGEVFAVIGNRESEGGPFIPAQIVVTETNLPNGWQLENISCVLADEGTPVNTTVDVGTATATVELSYNEADPLASQDDVICTFDNAPEPATITVIKNSSGGDDTFNFSWGSTNNPLSNFQLTTIGGTATTNPVITVTTGLGDTDFGVAEILQAGWDFVSATCVDELDQPVGTFGSIPPVYGVQLMTLNAGDDITCTFNNAKQGTVNIVKQTVGGNGTFGYTTNLPGTPTFTLMTTNLMSPAESRTVPAGTYTVTEDFLPAGWQFSSVECTEDGDQDSTTLGPVATLNVQDGETINCVYINTLDGEIITDKVTNPSGAPDVFTFTPSWGADFDLTDGDTPNLSGPLTPGLYSVSENPLDGWDLTEVTCTGQPGNTNEDPAAIDLNPGEVVTCRFTNTQRGTIQVVKSITVPTGTGPGTEDFDFTGTGPDGYNFGGGFILSTDVVDAEFMDFTDLVPGAYSVTEANPAADGWALIGVTCSGESFPDPVTNPATITLNPGENVICTFTNAPIGSTTITKVSEGGDGVEADFDFDFTWGNGTNPNVPLGESSVFTLNTFGDGTASREYNYKLIPLDPYDLVETGVPGNVGPYAQTWQLSAVGCSDPSPDNTIPDTVVPGANDADATIVTEANETVTCTFTNVLDGTLVIRKQTSNPDDFDQDFNFVGGVTGTVGGVAGTITDYDIAGEELFISGQPGFYGSAEENISGWEVTNIACTGQADNAQIEIGTAGNFTQPGYVPGDDRVRVDVGAGETIICTFTNQPFGSLTIIKNVQGDDATFNFTGRDEVNTPDIVTDFSIDTAGVDPDQQVFSGLAPGEYAVSELSPDAMGYDLTDIFCDAENSGVLIGVDDVFQPGDTGVTINLANGEDVTCTFTNTQRGTITLLKNLPNNNGGTAVETDFSAFISGNLVPWGVPQELVPGGYTASESTLPGYAPSGWFNACAQDGSVVLGAGENLVCEITNDDVAPTLTLNKVLPNDNGGTALASDFAVFIDGNPVSWGVPVQLDAGPHIASETPQPGYAPSPWSNACAGDGSVTLNPGDNLVCEITNDDIAPTLALVKVVQNNNDGTAVETDWVLSAAGPTPLSGAGGVAATAVEAGTYVLSESVGPDGYSPSAWNCTAGTLTVDSLELPVGVNAICTIINSDLPSVINLSKSAAPATDVGGGIWEVVYTITASNSGQGPGVYDITDMMSPGAGITPVIDASYPAIVYAGGETQTGTLTTPPLANGGTWVTAEELAIDATESWTVTARFTVDPTLTDPLTNACDSLTPVINTGFYNAVSGSVTDVDLTDNETCTGLPDPVINLAKTVNGPAAIQPDGTYTVVYTITATNSGQGPGVYDITDTMSPGTGITPVVDATYPGLVYAGGETQTGVLTAPPLANGGTWVTGEALAAGASESWTVTANFTVDPGTLDPATSSCDSTAPVINTGFYNAVSGSVTDVDPTDDQTCTGLLDAQINLAKTSTPAVNVGQDIWEVVYTITATNAGSGPGVYDVNDMLMPGAGITPVIDASYPAIVYAGGETQSGVIATPPLVNGGTWVSLEALGGQQSESWTVTARFTVDEQALINSPSDADCILDDGEQGTGYMNFVDGSETDVDLSDNETCVPHILLADTIAVPTLSTWAMLLMILLMTGVGGWYFRPVQTRRIS